MYVCVMRYRILIVRICDDVVINSSKYSKQPVETRNYETRNLELYLIWHMNLIRHLNLPLRGLGESLICPWAGSVGHGRDRIP